jgi:F0F1-type ATP synthase delta subunit
MRASSYSKALYAALRVHPENEDVVLQQFVGTVKENGHTHLFPKIIKSFARLNAKEEAKETIEVVSASPMTEGDVVALLKQEPYKQLLSAQHKRVVRKTDPNIVGGAVVRAGSVRMDGSHKRALLDIYQNFTNTL